MFLELFFKVLDDNRIGFMKDFLVEFWLCFDIFEGVCNVVLCCNGVIFLVLVVFGVLLVVLLVKDSVV